jgi:hypothetical protein
VDDLIPPEVRDFIIRHIDTVSQLEALLLLRANSEQDWDIATTARRVYASDEQIADVLERFSAERFVVRNGDVYRYQSRDADTDATIGRLASIYASHLIAITNMIHQKSRNLRSFSDAFKLRKDT